MRESRTARFTPATGYAADAGETWVGSYDICDLAHTHPETRFLTDFGILHRLFAYLAQPERRLLRRTKWTKQEVLVSRALVSQSSQQLDVTRFYECVVPSIFVKGFHETENARKKREK
jgi:hypothetical protein